MLIPIGIFASSGAIAAPGSFDLLESTVLTGTQATVSFTNLTSKYAANYQHLQVRLVAKDNRSPDASSRMYLRLNGVSSGYRWHELGGEGSVVYSGVGSATDRIIFQANTGNSGNFGASVIDLLDAFEANKNRTFRIFSGQLVSGFNLVTLVSGSNFSTSSTDSLLFGSDFGSFVAGTRLSLYGIKATA